MNIFESLEELNVSEECFNDILDIIKNYLMEDKSVGEVGDAARKVRQQRKEELQKQEKIHGYNSNHPDYKRALKRKVDASRKSEFPSDNNVSMKKLKEYGKIAQEVYPKRKEKVEKAYDNLKATVQGAVQQLKKDNPEHAKIIGGRVNSDTYTRGEVGGGGNVYNGVPEYSTKYQNAVDRGEIKGNKEAQQQVRDANKELFKASDRLEHSYHAKALADGNDHVTKDYAERFKNTKKMHKS